MDGGWDGLFIDIHRIDHHKSSQSHENPIMPWQGEATLGALAALLLQLGRLLSQLFPQLLSKLLRPPLHRDMRIHIHLHTVYVCTYTYYIRIHALLAYIYIYIYMITYIHIHIGTITISGGGDHQTLGHVCIYIYI
jgi:hypothetical protein